MESSKKLIYAHYIQNFQILLIYQDEAVRVADFKKMLQENLGDFENLKIEENFKKFSIDKTFSTIEWNDGYDICPEELYQMSKPVKISLTG
jgi:hypothetical protein